MRLTVWPSGEAPFFFSQPGCRCCWCLFVISLLLLLLLVSSTKTTKMASSPPPLPETSAGCREVLMWEAGREGCWAVHLCTLLYLCSNPLASFWLMSKAAIDLKGFFPNLKRSDIDAKHRNATNSCKIKKKQELEVDMKLNPCSNIIKDLFCKQSKGLWTQRYIFSSCKGQITALDKLYYLLICLKHRLFKNILQLRKENKSVTFDISVQHLLSTHFIWMLYEM